MGKYSDLLRNNSIRWIDVFRDLPYSGNYTLLAFGFMELYIGELLD